MSAAGGWAEASGYQCFVLVKGINYFFASGEGSVDFHF